MEFKKEFLLDILEEDKDVLIQDKMIDHDRWTILHEIVFKHGGKFYSTSYRVGATEMQYESPWEYEDDEIECFEVEEVDKIVKVYRKKNVDNGSIDNIKS